MAARLILLVTLIALLAACGDDDDGGGAATSTPVRTAAASGGDVTITVSDNKFEPAAAAVRVNNEVIWEWEGNNPHTVVGTFDNQRVESPRLTGSGTFVFSFARAGTFNYQCGVHGESMSGTITVQ
jgi:plastocyanin